MNFCLNFFNEKVGIIGIFEEKVGKKVKNKKKSRKCGEKYERLCSV